MNAIRRFIGRASWTSWRTRTRTARTGNNRFGPVDLLAESMVDIDARPVRLVMSVMGAALGIGALVASVGFAQTSAAHIAEQFAATAGRHAVVASATERSADGTELALTQLGWDAATQIERISGVEGAALLSQLSLRDGAISAIAIHDPSAPIIEQPLLYATSPNAIAIAGASILSGRMFDAGHDQRADRVAVVSARAAARLGIGSLSSQPSIFLGGMAFAVVGVYDGAKFDGDLQDAVVIPMGTGRSDFDLMSPDRLLVRLQVHAGPILADQAPLALSPNSPDDITVSAPGGSSELQTQVQSDVNAIFVILSIVIFLAGGFGIANVMMLSVMERIGEIGLRRAVGATQRQIAALFVTESVIVGTLGGLIGSAIGVISIDVVAFVQRWPVATHLAVPLAGIAIGALLGLVAGGLPARRAARLEPISALRGD